ncbi:helix-turn-helix domain-containing protein [Kineosporia corallincola]|uniref:helix-turn-helix domain-containing protein n=1 Tax=Kineosporia corallincola TaxID=2835133 RepID=UPI0027E02439|nr:helix-turn-helix transcriptional regulator [Kineosporia corallincola]
MATLKVPDRVTDLGAYVREQRENAKLSLRQLANAAGVSNPYLSQIERGLRKPSAEVLTQIAKGLQISAEALFQRAGLLEESVGVEVEVAIQSDVRLTARQKRVLLDIYSTFRAENARQDAQGERIADDPDAIVGTVVPLIARSAGLKPGQDDTDQATATEEPAQGHPAGTGRRGARKRVGGRTGRPDGPRTARSSLRQVDPDE